MLFLSLACASSLSAAEQSIRDTRGEQTNTAAAPSQSVAAEANAKPKLSIDGEIEASASYTNLENSRSSSELNAKANIGFNVSYLSWINLRAALEVETTINYTNAADILDEAYIKLGKDSFPLFVKAGKFGVAFWGTIESAMFSDSMTKEFGEIKLAAVEAGVKFSFITIGAGVFKSSKELNKKYGSNHINEGYVYLKIAPPVLKDFVITFSAITNMVDGGFLAGSYDEYTAASNPSLTHRIPGLSAGFTFGFWKLKVNAEIVAALKGVEWLSNKKPYAAYAEIVFDATDLIEAVARFEKGYKLEYKTKAGLAIRFKFSDFKLTFEYLFMKKDDANGSVGSKISSAVSLTF
jgi:hypothetical protein